MGDHAARYYLQPCQCIGRSLGRGLEADPRPRVDAGDIAAGDRDVTRACVGIARPVIRFAVATPRRFDGSPRVKAIRCPAMMQFGAGVGATTQSLTPSPDETCAARFFPAFEFSSIARMNVG